MTDRVFTYETTFTKIQLDQAGPIAGDLLAAAAKNVLEAATFAATEANYKPFFATITVRAHVVASKNEG
jgi:hypothetical protein